MRWLKKMPMKKLKKLLPTHHHQFLAPSIVTFTPSAAPSAVATESKLEKSVESGISAMFVL